ncbi:MAG: methyltransferase domain-containing protein [Thaumarchaeota archaeon]|nr:methyltransferase domain-containing protein [Nitrososphaerota archaeon]MBI3642438.1 methyltransferase domain-containing protein [Nitrososphaerota archaeon]
MQNKSIKTEYYLPAEDTLFFADHIQNEKGKSALDIGTGSGYLANVLLPNFEVVVATDISFDATKKAHNLIQNCICCTSADPLAMKFDLVICNMPYLPSEEIIDSTVDGLDEGLIVPLQIIKSVKNVIKKGGKMIYLTSSLANHKKLLEETESSGFYTKIFATKKMFFEELILVEAVLK